MKQTFIFQKPDRMVFKWQEIPTAQIPIKKRFKNRATARMSKSFKKQWHFTANQLFNKQLLYKRDE